MILNEKIKTKQIENLFSSCYLITIYFKIFINYQQTINIISGIKLEWPFQINTFFFSLKFLSFFTQTAPSLECLYEGYSLIF